MQPLRTPSESGYITSAQLRARFGGISDMTLWRWLNRPEMHFPKPAIIERRRYWRIAEIESWEESQLRSRRAA
jgi:predicted DNA-binding transcriptional regulator AlpA